MSHTRSLLGVLVSVAILGLVILGLLKYQGVLSDQREMVAAVSALIGTLAVCSSFLVFAVNIDRDRNSRALDISRRWDSEPLLTARRTLRPFGADADQISRFLVRSDDDGDSVKDAIIHMANFFWDMSIAINVKMAAPEFLRQRFKVSLSRLSPSFAALLAANPEDKAIDIAISSINQLCRLWEINPIAVPSRTAAGE